MVSDYQLLKEPIKRLLDDVLLRAVLHKIGRLQR